MEIGSLKEIIFYPIKSISGIVVDTCDVDARGLSGDRKFAIYNAEGKIASGKNTRRFIRLDNIIDIQVKRNNSNLYVVSEDGTALIAPSKELDRYLSNLLGIGLQVKSESQISHMDDGQVHLITTADLDSLSEKHGKVLTQTRFRPNFLVESEYLSSDFLKYDVLKIGEVVFKPTKHTERCRMVTMVQSGCSAEPTLLKTIAVSGKVNFGIYLQPIELGSVKTGCNVELL